MRTSGARQHLRPGRGAATGHWADRSPRQGRFPCSVRGRRGTSGSCHLALGWRLEQGWERRQLQAEVDAPCRTAISLVRHTFSVWKRAKQHPAAARLAGPAPCAASVALAPPGTRLPWGPRGQDEPGGPPPAHRLTVHRQASCLESPSSLIRNRQRHGGRSEEREYTYSRGTGRTRKYRSPQRCTLSKEKAALPSGDRDPQYAFYLILDTLFFCLPSLCK